MGIGGGGKVHQVGSGQEVWQGRQQRPCREVEVVVGKGMGQCSSVHGKRVQVEGNSNGEVRSVNGRNEHRPSMGDACLSVLPFLSCPVEFFPATPTTHVFVISTVCPQRIRGAKMVPYH